MITYISMAVAIIVITGLIYYMLKSKAGGKRKFNPKNIDSANPSEQAGGLNSALVRTKWTEITAMQTHGPSGLKNALSEADKLLDYVMIQKGFSGETMGDRLKSGGSAFSNLNNIWAAHKLRNQMAHEVEHDMVPEEIKHAINNLGQGIRDLGVQL